MSAFKRRSPATEDRDLPGVRLCPQPPFCPMLSTGLPSFDDVLGGGLPMSSSLLIASPDLHSAWGDLLQKYYISQGLISGQDICLVGDPDQLGVILGSCMWVPAEGVAQTSGQHGDTDDENETVASEDVKIAWRYGGLKRFNTTVAHDSAVPSRSNYCTDFDLTRRIPEVVIDKAKEDGRIRTVPVNLSDSEKFVASAWPDIVAVCCAHSHAGNSVKRALRIAIMVPAALDLSPTVSQRSFIQFIHNVRNLVRTSNATSTTTLPPHMSSSSVYAALRSALVHLSDAAVTLASDSLNALTRHHGILQLEKLPTIKSLVSPSDKLSTLRGLGTTANREASNRGGGENNLAFRCKRRVFVIETLNLDAEGGTGERRTAPPTAVLLPTLSPPGQDAGLQPDSPLGEVATWPKGHHLVHADEVSGIITEKKTRPKRRVAFRDAEGLYDF